MPNPIDLSKDPFFSSEFARAEMQGEAKIITEFLKTGKFSPEDIAAFGKVPLQFVLEIRDRLYPPKKKGRTKKI